MCDKLRLYEISCSLNITLRECPNEPIVWSQSYFEVGKTSLEARKRFEPKKERIESVLKSRSEEYSIGNLRINSIEQVKVQDYQIRVSRT